MPTVRRLYGASIVVFIGAKQVSLGGVEQKLDMTGRVAWPRIAETRGGVIALAEIPKATVMQASNAEVQELKFDGDKSSATWLKLFLPGGEGASDFAMRSIPDDVLVYVGSAIGSTDAVPAMTPFKIERITTGDEGIF